MFKQLLTLAVLALGLAACGTATPSAPEPEAAAPSTPTDQTEAQLILKGDCSLRPCNWGSLGGAINLGSGSRGTFPDLALDPAGNPVVSLVEKASAFDHVGSLFVRRWNGTAWVAFGGAVASINTTWPFAPILTLDQAGLPIVAYWNHYNASNPSYVITVKRWNGSSWLDLGRVPCALPEGFGDLALDVNNQPLFVCNSFNSSNQVGYLEFFRFSGAWSRSHNNIPQASYPKLAVDASNRLVVGFRQSGGALGAMRSAGAGWQSLGSVGVSAGGGYDMGLDSSGSPVFAAFGKSGSQTQLNVRQLVGGAFVAVGTPNQVAFKDWTLSLAVGAANQIAVAFSNTNGVVQVQRYNSSANTWGFMGTTVNSATNPFGFAATKLAFRPNGNPVVAWQEYESSSAGWVYAKQWVPSLLPPPVVIQ